MKLKRLAVLLSVVTAALSAQESGIAVRAVRVLATDPEAIAIFYEKAFGMSEIGRPRNSDTFKEIRINFGSTAALASKTQSPPLVITTRPKDAPAGAMAALILQVPDIDRAIEAAKAAGGTVFRPVTKSSPTQAFAFLKDPDGNQIELVMTVK